MNRREHLLCLLVALSLCAVVFGCGESEDDGQNASAAVEAPTDVTASDATSTSHVLVEWESVDGAEEYYVYRDGERIDEVEYEEGIERYESVDDGADPAGRPSAPTQVEAVWELDIVEVSWEPVHRAVGPSHEYVVVASIGERVSEDSQPAKGRRVGDEISHYEIEVDGLGYFFDVGDQPHWIDDDVASELLDEEIDEPTLIAGAIQAQQVSSLEYVEFSTEEPTLDEGGTVSYRVRAVDDGGQTSEASEVVGATRIAEDYELWWQRSVDDDPNGDFVDLDVDCADELVCEDHDTVGLGESRFYRVKWSVPEVSEPIYSAPPAEAYIDSCDPFAAPFGDGVGSSESPWQICSIDHIAEISEDSDYFTQYFRMHSDLVFGDGAPGWPRINISGTSFDAVFDGNGHTIYDIHEISEGKAGMFSSVGEDGWIQNLNVENVDLEFQSGAVLANSNSGVIENVTVSGVVHTINESDSDLTGSVAIGGVVAINTSFGSGGEMIAVHSDVDITVDEDWASGIDDSLRVRVGGLAGQNMGEVTRSSSSGDINVYDYIAIGQVGGLLGTNTGLVTESRTTGVVDGALHTGGLVGRWWNTGQVRDSYSWVELQGTSQGIVGGLVGRMQDEVSTSYASGLIDVDTSSAGGVMGSGFGIERSYWDIDTTEELSSSGGSGLTTAEFGDEDNFEDWDFDNVWTMGVDDDGNARPVLQWE